jgi:LuxR family maltose regulon positive regulatory protein
LIAARGKYVEAGEVSDLLWPEAEGDAAYSTFKSNLSRLRQLLGWENTIRFQQGKVLLDARRCWVDAWEFENICEQVEEVLRRFRQVGGGGGHRSPKKGMETESEEVIRAS